MSGWDAPTGSWDSRPELDESSGPDEQGYQQGEPAGSHRAVRGGEGRLRAGRRGLPGYEQAQNYDQTAGDQGPGYGEPPGYGQQGYGPGTGPQPSFGSGSDAGQMVRYGQGVVGYGEGATAAYRQYSADDSSRSGWSDAGDQQGYGDRQGYGYQPGYGDRPGYSDQPGYGDRPGYSDQPGYGDRPGYSDQPGYGSSPGYGARPGSGSHGSGGEPGYGPPSQLGQDYGQNSFLPNTPSTPGGQPGSGQGYEAQPGYGPPGYGQSGYGQQASSPGGFPPGGFAGQADQSRMGQDYQTDVYPQPGSEPSGYPQNGFGENGFGQDPGVTQAYATQPGYGQNGFDPNFPNSPGVPTAPGAPNGQATYTADGYGQGGFGAPGSRQDGYPQDPYAKDPYAQDPYGQAGYDQPGFEQPGFEQPAGPGYDDDDDVAAQGRAPRSRSGPPRSGPGAPQHLAGARMALYLAAAVVSVVVIVILVVQLTKSGGNKAAAGSSTPSTGSTAATGSNATSGYVFIQAAKVGTSFPLNKTATKALTPTLVTQSAPIADQIKTRGYGKPGKVTVGVYNLTPVTSINSSAYKGIAFVGYDGTFNPKSVINLVRSTLVSSRVVNPGPHGGDMVCGYDTSGGSGASECVWVTKTTFGQVHFLEGEVAVKYPEASKFTLEVRNAVEVKPA